MTDRMHPLSFDSLMRWVLKDPGDILGVVPYKVKLGTTRPLFGGWLELPIGPAAGPHTQLAQNIVCAYAAGARFFELKTVQTLDGEDLPVSKPCILAADEGYNVEWSTELTVPQALSEYIHAWFALKLIAHEYGLGDPGAFVFNMSVGYDYEGISSPKIDAFLEGLKDARRTDAFEACRAWALEHLGLFRRVDRAYVDGISPRVANSVTLSTLHGCPPAEIERIAAYLLEQKGLHTYVKLNPTLLGYAFARDRLDKAGYDGLVFDDRHFRHDLQYGDALPMLARLLQRAAGLGLAFGVKLTNTLPVGIANGELPGEEMYMSGRPLFLLSTVLASKLAADLGGGLPISYSGGADAQSVPTLLAAGLFPVTVATTALKPGGYRRLTQMAEMVSGASAIRPDAKALRRIAEEAALNPAYTKDAKALPVPKNGRKVPALDCAVAPCADGCPIGQDIPAYLRLVGEGRYAEALQVITDKNPLPFITGTLCNHRCQGSCRRNFYEEAVHIRDAKLLAAENGMDVFLSGLQRPAAKGPKVAVVGGGPAGLAAAYFLARQGLQTTVFEKEALPGGVVRHVIPPFRIAGEAVDRDVSLIKAMGVAIETNREIRSLAPLREAGYAYILLAVGAGGRRELALEGTQPWSATHFLRAFRAAPDTLRLGKHVAVVGGGNTAMDTARAALRVPGVSTVTLVYRRGLRELPADGEELRLAQAEGVRLLTLRVPLRHADGALTCEVMRLGAPGADGRRSVKAAGETVGIPAESPYGAISSNSRRETVGIPAESPYGAVSSNSRRETETIPADTVIAAIGETVDTAFYAALETGEDTYIIGDGNAGPGTVVEAIADARNAVDDILRRAGIQPDGMEPPARGGFSAAQKGFLQPYGGMASECGRCLACDTTCSCCAEVCPNRANIPVAVDGRAQILHVDRLCNACGNCETFCPYDSAPYKEKFTLFETEKDFADSAAPGMVVPDKSARAYKLRADRSADALAQAVLSQYDFLL